MTLPVHFDPAAQEELDAAHDWYEDRSPGVGVEFVSEARQAVEQIATWPALGRPVSVPGTMREFRRTGLRRFPYGILYAIFDDKVVVVAVAHDRRRPGYWHERQSR